MEALGVGFTSACDLDIFPGRAHIGLSNVASANEIPSVADEIELFFDFFSGKKKPIFGFFFLIQKSPSGFEVCKLEARRSSPGREWRSTTEIWASF